MYIVAGGGPGFPSSRDTIGSAILSANQPPLADAGHDLTVRDTDGNGTHGVTLSGKGSVDNDSASVSHRWLLHGKQIATGLEPTFDFPVGRHSVVLGVKDDDGAEGYSQVLVTVLPKTAPVPSPVGLVMWLKADSLMEVDDGSPIVATIWIKDGRATFDFSGTAPRQSGNLNATAAITRSVVVYVLRLLAGKEAPLNEGFLDPVEILIPQDSLLAPFFAEDPEEAPAVAGGNVELSQRLVDTLLLAFGEVACSQGTMNNVIFGDATRSHYETVAGGAGAGIGFDGVSGIHTHMTNTAITDPEILEIRQPVRLERFLIRQGSGGPGSWTGGDGLEREYLFIDPMSVSLLTQRRKEGPEGIAGGGPGQPGAQYVIRADDTREDLSAVVNLEVQAGDRLVLMTPGGGGAGQAETLA